MAGNDRTEIDDIVGRYLDRLNAGETIDPLQVVADHPEQGQEILDRLEAFVGLGLSGEDPLGTLGDYTLRRQIGRGGMGVTCAALRYVKSFPCASLNLFPSIRLRPCGPSDCCT